MNMDRARIPSGTRYAIQTLEEPVRTAFFGDLEDVVRCMVDMDLAFDCQVIRTMDDVLVWPIKTRGGQA